MSVKRKTWKAWAIDFIKATDTCPGDEPPTGGMDDKHTEEEFRAMARAGGTHKWDSCHYVDEILGLTQPEGFKALSDSGSSQVTKQVSDIAGSLFEVEKSKRFAAFKQRLHEYVNRIELHEDKVSIPSQLLKLSEYANSFFN